MNIDVDSKYFKILSDIEEEQNRAIRMPFNEWNDGYVEGFRRASELYNEFLRVLQEDLDSVRTLIAA